MDFRHVKYIGESIADYGGINIAYRAYLKWLKRNKAKPSLPGLRYTPRQLFWISSATNWCVKKETDFSKQFDITFRDPFYFQFLAPFMNSDYFGKDFNCSVGSPMNPEEKCRV